MTQNLIQLNKTYAKALILLKLTENIVEMLDSNKMLTEKLL